MIESDQRLIQIGSSQGITLSKKDLARLGAKRGDLLHVKVELAQKPGKHEKLMREYEAFVAQYGQTLRNLTDR